MKPITFLRPLPTCSVNMNIVAPRLAKKSHGAMPGSTVSSAGCIDHRGSKDRLRGRVLVRTSHLRAHQLHDGLRTHLLGEVKDLVRLSAQGYFRVV